SPPFQTGQSSIVIYERKQTDVVLSVNLTLFQLLGEIGCNNQSRTISQLIEHWLRVTIEK
ncbi:hypothetical protein ABTQ07_22350, partial [Acinetobacter baumannii]